MYVCNANLWNQVSWNNYFYKEKIKIWLYVDRKLLSHHLAETATKVGQASRRRVVKIKLIPNYYHSLGKGYFFQNTLLSV